MQVDLSKGIQSQREDSLLNWMTDSQQAIEAAPNETEEVKPPRNILTAIQSIDGADKPNLLSALIEMDRQELQKDMSNAPVPIKRKRKIASVRFQPTRIKKIMQSDEEIGRMKDGVPAAIGKAMEHFAEQFLLACVNEVKAKNSKTLGPKDMKAAMLSNPNFAFLEKILGQIASPPKKPKDVKVLTIKEKTKQATEEK